MKRFLIELFSVGSRLLNVLRGGTADITLSAAAHREGLRIKNLIDAVFRLFGKGDHCRVWWLREVERSRENIRIHEERDLG